MLGSVWCNGFDPCASPLEVSVGVVLVPFCLVFAIPWWQFLLDGWRFFPLPFEDFFSFFCFVEKLNLLMAMSIIGGLGNSF